MKLLNKDHIVVDRLRAIKSKKIDQVEKIGAARPGATDTIFVVTERLPLQVMRVLYSQKYGLGWFYIVNILGH